MKEYKLNDIVYYINNEKIIKCKIIQRNIVEWISDNEILNKIEYVLENIDSVYLHTDKTDIYYANDNNNNIFEERKEAKEYLIEQINKKLEYAKQQVNKLEKQIQIIKKL